MTPTAEASLLRLLPLMLLRLTGGRIGGRSVTVTAAAGGRFRVSDHGAPNSAGVLPVRWLQLRLEAPGACVCVCVGRGGGLAGGS